METTLVINQQPADFELFYDIILADGASVATPVPAVAWDESLRRSPAIEGHGVKQWENQGAVAAGKLFRPKTIE